MDSDKSSGTFTDEEYEAFINSVVRASWEASRDADVLHDISIKHVEKDREILIDSANNRVSYRNSDSGEWGLQQKQVQDLRKAVTKLQTVSLFVPMNEMHYLGLGEHPERPNKLKE